MERKLSRKSNVAEDKRGRWERKVFENGEKYHMKSQYDVVFYILLSMSDLLISGTDHSNFVGQVDRS